MQAAEEARWDLLLFLVEKGADVSQANRDGRTAAMVVADRIEAARRLGEEPPAPLVGARDALEHAATTR